MPLEAKLHDVKPSIPPELWRAARVEALREGVTVGAWIAEAIRLRLNPRPETRKDP